MRCARVILQDEAAQQLRLRRLAGAVKWVTVVADHLSIPYVGDLDVYLPAASRVRDDVVVVAAVREHLLAVRDLFNRLQLIAITRRILEVQLARRAFHPHVELANEHVRPALHEQRDLVDASPVIVGANAPLARSRTSLDVIVEAHLALLEDLVGARPEGQQLPD